jgi:hypothetical protein
MLHPSVSTEAGVGRRSDKEEEEDELETKGVFAAVETAPGVSMSGYS